MEDEARTQFRVSYVREQQAPIRSPVVAANDGAGPRGAEHVIEGSDVLDFAVFFRHWSTQRLSLQRLQLRFGSAAKILPYVDQFDVVSHLPLRDQLGPGLVWVHPRAERQYGLRQWSTVLLKTPYPSQRSRRHPAHGFGDPPQHVVDAYLVGAQRRLGCVRAAAGIGNDMGTSTNQTHCCCLSSAPVHRFNAI